MRAVLIHGWGGSPEEGWRPWLADELRSRGFDVAVPAMPDTNHPKVDEWLSHLAEVVGQPSEDCILVGHSLGCPTILRYLEQLHDDEEMIGAAIMIAGFFEHIDDEYNEIRPFVHTTFDGDTIRSHCNYFSVIHSDDDDVVPLPFAERLASKLGVPMVIEHGYKHYSGGDGITTIPTVLRIIEQIAGKRGHS